MTGNQLNLVAIRNGLTGKAPGDVLAGHGPVGGPDEVRNGAASQLLRRQAHQGTGGVVGENHPIPVHQDHLGHGVGQIMEQRLALPHLAVLGIEGVEQAIDVVAQLADLVDVAGGQRDALAKDRGLCSLEDFAVQGRHATGVVAAGAPQVETTANEPKAGRGERQDQPSLGHAGVAMEESAGHCPSRIFALSTGANRPRGRFEA